MFLELTAKMTERQASDEASQQNFELEYRHVEHHASANSYYLT
jgi:hypothetical protein